MEFVLTPEQEAIIAAARGSSASISIRALAGAAKTTTLTLFAKKLPIVPTLCCAFNKSIAVDMAKAMPSHITCSTMNALGHKAWAQATGKRLSVDTDKTYLILLEITSKVAPELKRKAGEAFPSLLRMVRLAKANGYVPEAFAAMATSLVDLDDFLDAIANDLDIEPDDDIIDWFHAALQTSITDSFSGKIDFDDQIYMSTLFGGRFAQYPIILVDEAQDLSPLNHQMLRLMFGGRLVAVGDPFQSIYGFRGADQHSMAKLEEEFEMTLMTLNTSFRCPIAVVERARFRAPAMTYPDWAKPGKVERLGEYTPTQFHDGDWILCRNNSPLFSMALKLIKAGRGIHLKKSDIGRGLIKVMEKFGPANLPQDIVLSSIQTWEEEQLDGCRPSREAGIRDRAECMRVFARTGNSLGEALAYANHLFSSVGPIQLMTGHGAKGLENPVIYHLDPFLIPSKYALRLAEVGDMSKLEQEKNLRYVIETRPQSDLYLIDSEDFRFD